MSVAGELQGDAGIVVPVKGVRFVPGEDRRHSGRDLAQDPGKVRSPAPVTVHADDGETGKGRDLVHQNACARLFQGSHDERGRMPAVVIAEDGHGSETGAQGGQFAAKRQNGGGVSRDIVAQEQDKVDAGMVHGFNRPTDQADIAKIIVVKVGQRGNGQSGEGGVPGPERHRNSGHGKLAFFHSGSVGEAGGATGKHRAGNPLASGNLHEKASPGSGKWR